MSRVWFFAEYRYSDDGGEVVWMTKAMHYTVMPTTQPSAEPTASPTYGGVPVNGVAEQCGL